VFNLVGAAAHQALCGFGGAQAVCVRFEPGDRGRGFLAGGLQQVRRDPFRNGLSRTAGGGQARQCRPTEVPEPAAAAQEPAEPMGQDVEHRASSGNVTIDTSWLQHADHEVDPLRRSAT